MKSVAVYRVGQLGDTVVALPALWEVRRAFPQASLSLIYDRWPERGLPTARDVLEGSGLVDDWIAYDAMKVLASLREAWHLLRSLRRRRFEVLVYLAPSERHSRQVVRDLAYFRLAGISRFVAHRGFRPQLADWQEMGGPFPRVLSEADHLLHRLARSGLEVPGVGRGRMELPLTGAEHRWAAAWLRQNRSDRGREGSLVAVAPGAKSPDKQWGESCYRQFGRQLCTDEAITPMVIGGSEDMALGRRLVSGWGRGIVAAGKTTVRQSAALLARCKLFVGNDSGPMHLAAAMGVPCVAVFSGRDAPGMWEPYAAEETGHAVLRKDALCFGCSRTHCLHERHCLRRITVEEVYGTCRSFLQRASVGKK